MTSTRIRLVCASILSAAFAGCQPGGAQGPVSGASNNAAPASDGGQVSVGGRLILPGGATLSNSAAAAPPSPAAKANAAALAGVDWQQRGERAGKLRKSFFSGGKLTPDDVDFIRAVQAALASPRTSPQDFARFQSSTIVQAIGIAKESLVEDIRRELEKAATVARAGNISLVSETVGAEPPIVRATTDVIKKMLNPDERASFDRLFRDAVRPDLRLMAAP